MATTKSGPLDAMVGARIKMFRLDRGMSQTMLAGRIGVTFQQVQQFGRGAGRVGASRLAQIASALGVSVGELFESSRTESCHYARTTGPRLRLCIANLVEGIAARTPRTKATVAHLHAVDRSQRRRFSSRG
jgi:transcriptional regulator with XRE-family HTH domain